MNEFLDLNPPHKFWQLLKNNIEFIPEKIEKVGFKDSLNRILAKDIMAPINLPPFNRSTVDGFAVRANDIAGANQSLPVYLDIIGEVLMGKSTDLELRPGTAVGIPTGGMIPTGADAVIMIEYTEYLDDKKIEVFSSVAVGENVIQKGEDIERGNLLLEKGDQIRPQDIGAMAGLGITEIEVYKRPEIAIIATGDELVSPEKDTEAGEIRDINSYSIGSLLKELNTKPRYIGIIEDSFSRLKKAVKNNLDADLILISGGSSVGVKDMTIDILNSLGEPGVLLHGISIKPGKPTIMAVIDGKPVLGLPGHPASSWTVSNKLVKPLVKILNSQKSIEFNCESGEEKDKFYKNDSKLEAILNRNLVSDKGREEYIPIKLLSKTDIIENDRPEKDINLLSKEDISQNNISVKDISINYLAEPIRGKSSLITTLVEADGFISIGTYQEGLNRGDRVEVELF